jgi:hypothetical protein
MTNAKEELMSFLSRFGGMESVVAMETTLLATTKANEDVELSHTLPVGYGEMAVAEVLAMLNRDYDAGYGQQYLYGTIWFRDGSWGKRVEYDGSEKWKHYRCPPLPA